MTLLGFYERQEPTRSTKIFDRMCWHRAYFLSYRKPNYPMPAIPLAVLIVDDRVIIAEPDYWEGQIQEFIEVCVFYRN